MKAIQLVLMVIFSYSLAFSQEVEWGKQFESVPQSNSTFVGTGFMAVIKQKKF